MLIWKPGGNLRPGMLERIVCAVGVGCAVVCMVGCGVAVGVFETLEPPQPDSKKRMSRLYASIGKYILRCIEYLSSPSKSLHSLFDYSEEKTLIEPGPQIDQYRCG